jgi:preprotein translocase SecE subunit
MNDNQPKRRRPRIRKAALTVREKIEHGTKASLAKPKKANLLRKLLRHALRLMRPAAPIYRLILRILRAIVPRYLVNSWRELRLVSWPNRRETWRLTAAVMIFAIVFGFLVWAVDLGLDQIFKRFVLR